MITARTDVVGSLLRPPWLLQAREHVAAGRITHAAFKAIEDRAVDEAVTLQEEAGLDVVTDGEMRRLSFQSQLPEAVEGFGAWDVIIDRLTNPHPVDGKPGAPEQDVREGSVNANCRPPLWDKPAQNRPPWASTMRWLM
jgi:methionine synthase II (cobalamin-independent)